MGCKSTFINILGGIVIKASGSVNVWGYDIDKDPRQVRASLGIVPQELNLDPFLIQEDFWSYMLVCTELKKRTNNR